MHQIAAGLIIKALLERLDSDSKSAAPQYESVVSNTEREALRTLIASFSLEENKSPVARAVPDTATTISTSPELPPVPVGEDSITLDLSCLKASGEHSHVVCIDFGTAKSKAFASRLPGSQDEDIASEDLMDLGIGNIDGDLDGSPYTVASSIWISDDGLMFAGSHALRHSRQYANDGRQRERLDSLKQTLTLAYDEHDASHPLSARVNPSGINLTYEEAICFFLAYLTDLVGNALEKERKLSRYTPRRFTVPAWKSDKRQWAVKTLSSSVEVAQLLADTFRGRWSKGIPVADVKSALSQAKLLQGRLGHLIDRSLSSSTIGISEPVAAGTARLITDPNLRNLLLVVDVGAGTTDFAMFWVTTAGAFPVTDSVARNMAGDLIDKHLVDFLLTKAGYKDEETRRMLERDVRLKGLRTLKQRLFDSKLLEVELATHETVSITLDEFLAGDGIKNFSRTLETHLENFLATIDHSYSGKASSPVIVFTGGGANLPFVRDLKKRTWNIAGQTVRFQSPTRPLSEVFTQFDESTFSQLAVAIGGSIGAIDEKTPLYKFPANAPPPPRQRSWV